MKTTGKDIMMICKGHFNHDKYKNTKDAIDGYYRKLYRITKEVVPELSYYLTLKFLISDCAREFITKNTYNDFLCNVFLDFMKTNHESSEDVYKSLFDKMTEWISSIRVRDKNNNWIIDLSDYDGEVI